MQKSMIAMGWALGLGLAGAAHAETTAAPAALPDIQVVACRTHNADQEKADLDLAMRAMKVMQTHDASKTEALLPELHAALDRAPDVPTRPELCGDKVVIYTDDLSKFLILSVAVKDGKIAGARTAEMRYEMPYGHLGFNAGWIAFERKDYAAALKDYEKGLRNDPDMPPLEAEYLLTLSLLGRNAEGLKAADDFLASHPGLNNTHRGMILRKKGYILVELGRWDEAETAYKQSLEADPGNATAKGELDYIAKTKPKT